MPNFRYRALTQNGEIVNGTLSAPTAAEVAPRIEYLRLLPIETVEEKRTTSASGGLGLFGRPSPAEVTTFTRDLALLLKAGARLDDALELLASDADVGRLRPVVGKLRAALLSGESLADAVAAHPALFPPMYVALVRVGEVSGTLDQVLEMLGAERARSEQMRRKLTDAMQYPLFVLIAAVGVMLFFILFVLPQFSSVLQDFGTKSDSALSVFIQLSEFLRANATALLLARRNPDRRDLVAAAAAGYERSDRRHDRADARRCRHLSILPHQSVLPQSRRPARQRRQPDGDLAHPGRHHGGDRQRRSWTAAADRVRHGGKLSDALSASSSLPPMAVRMLRLGEETGQLPALAGRVAEFYEAKLQRSLDRIVGIVGPLAIVTISTVVGGLIVSVMTALLSVTQLVG